MKTTLLSVLTLSSFVAFAADTVRPSNAAPATITGVSISKDKRKLAIHYELAGHAQEQWVAFTNDITDFRYCRWLGDQGVAVVATVSTEETYFTTLYLSGGDVPASPVKIPAPAGKTQLVGVANTGGDSIVITAVQHRRDGADRLTGWMYIDNCPPGASKVGAGVFMPFDLSRPQDRKSK
jgi:hypothetical protein